MKQRIAVLNDRKIPMHLRILDSSYNPGESQEKFYTLQPAEMKLVEFDIPEGSTPWLKIWEDNTAMLSYISAGFNF